MLDRITGIKNTGLKKRVLGDWKLLRNPETGFDCYRPVIFYVGDAPATAMKVFLQTTTYQGSQSRVTMTVHTVAEY